MTSPLSRASCIPDLIVKGGVKYDSFVNMYNKFVSAISYAIEVKGGEGLEVRIPILSR